MIDIKRVLFSVESTRNIYWDDTPITIGCELVIPNKWKGNQPLCIISHGSGGLGSDTDLFVNSLGQAGIATLCVDSFTGRSMSAIGWTDFSGYVSPRVRALETVEAYKYLKDNQELMFPGLELDKLAIVGFSWGADSVANIIAHYDERVPKNTFFALCYGNLWPFEPEFYKAKDYDVTLYHGADDVWTSPEKSKIFADQTNSVYKEFFGCTHGFCKPGYKNEVAENVIVNHHAPFPIPTRIRDVFGWIQKGKIWKDTDWKRVNAKLSYDQLATENIITDIIGKLK